MAGTHKRAKEFRGIDRFLKGLTFKKSLLGANTKDVYACIEDLDAMYADVLAGVKREYEERLESCRQQANEQLARKEREAEWLREQTRQAAQREQALRGQALREQAGPLQGHWQQQPQGARYAQRQAMPQQAMPQPQQGRAAPEPAAENSAARYYR